MSLKMNLSRLTLSFAAGIFIFVNAPAFAQQYARQGIWEIGGNGLDAGNDIQQTTDGGFVIAGYTFSYGAGYCDVYVAKVDRSGTLQWTKVIGTPDLEFGHSVQLTDDKGYIVSGRLLSNSTGHQSAYVIKLDSSGAVTWKKTYSSDIGNSICTTSDGGYAIGGTTSGNISVVKLDAAGAVQWSKNYGGSEGESGESVQQTSDGGYIVAGSTNSFGAGGNDVYVVKLDAAGNIEWTRTIGGAGDDQGKSVRQTSDGGYIIGGYTELPAGEGTPSDINAYMIKLTASGDISWTRSIGGNKSDYIFSIRQTRDGGYITGGYSQSFAAPGSTLLSDSSAFYVIKTDGSGTVEWSRAFSHQANITNVNNGTYAIRQTTDGGYAGVGIWYNSETNFSNQVYILKLDSSGNSCDGISAQSDEQAGPMNSVSDSGIAVGFTTAVNDIGQVTSGGDLQVECQVDGPVPPSGIEGHSLMDHFSLYPVPAHNRLFIDQSGEKHSSLKDITIYNVLGRKVVERKISGSNRDALSIDISMLHPGVYYIQLTDIKGLKGQRKFVKQ